MWLFSIGDEELRSICVRAIICHGNNSTDTVLKDEQENGTLPCCKLHSYPILTRNYFRNVPLKKNPKDFMLYQKQK